MGTDIFENAKSSNLYRYILSSENVYNAIYSLESYVFEKGLLSVDDLRTYYCLGDKYDTAYIQRVILECQRKLEEILSSPEKLFDVEVYFKIKKYDKDKEIIKFRPLHTARLIDQICMVCLLMPLMYDDSSGTRKLSDLAKLIPHNFFGNIPSCDVDRLFELWQKKYKEYSDATIHHCREYKKNHKYNTEVSLDIIEFFPSINPQYIHKFIVEKLSTSYTESNDKDCIKVITSKLLYFHLNENNIKPWEKSYYGIQLEGNERYMVRGIPQGLPQSYFFGNLCMIGISKEMKKVFKDSDLYFYVDDSVIYANTEYKSDDDFKKQIIELNVSLSNDLFNSPGDIGLKELLDAGDIEFQKTISDGYKIQFHNDDKSTYCRIDEADSQLGGEENLARIPSMVGNIFNSYDEIDDSISLEKLNAYLAVTENQIRLLQELESKDETTKSNRSYASKLKRMRRFKRFFLFRQLVFNIRRKGELADEMVNHFKTRFHIHDYQSEHIAEWFDNFEADIFASECHIMIDMKSLEQANLLMKIPNRNATNWPLSL